MIPFNPFYTPQGSKLSSSFLDINNIRTSTFDAYAAAWENGTVTLLWAFYVLSQHPEAQRKIRKEITAITNDTDAPNYEDRHDMPFTLACLDEVMRFKPGMFLLPHHAAENDTVIAGYDVPKGTAVVPNYMYLTHSPKIWDNPYEFNPNRFLKDGIFVRRAEVSPFSFGN